MNINCWIKNNTCSLKGKTVAITGSTGGIGGALCEYIAGLGGNLILLDRNMKRSSEHAGYLSQKYGVKVDLLTLDLENMRVVAGVCEKLKEIKIDYFIHNAGAYSIPRHKCESGYDNVFQINFLSPYYITRELMPSFEKVGGRFVFVGSIAHNYSKINTDDVDFSSYKASSKVYGNAKRWLMCSVYAKEKDKNTRCISVTHPGISFTGITAHYPKLVFAIIKHPMKIIFPKPPKACASVLWGLFENTDYLTWIGPRIFNVWGYPTKKKLHTISEKEIDFVGEYSERMYLELKNKFAKK